VSIPETERATRVRRDTVAVVLILLGGIGLAVTTWLVDPLLCAALVSGTVLGVGVYLGFER
jgi:uncharacterized membrane protein (DUF441 family)